MFKRKRRFELLVAEPWNFDGPDGENRIVAEFEGFVNGPEEPNWQSRFLLLRPRRPFKVSGELVQFLVAAPRHAGCTLEGIADNGGSVGVLRVREGVTIWPGSNFTPEDVEYIIIGDLSTL